MVSILHLIGEILDKTLNTNSVHMALFVAHNEIDDLSKALSLSREASLFLSVFTNLGDSEVTKDILSRMQCLEHYKEMNRMIFCRIIRKILSRQML